jgi:hypothetical protein
METMRSMLSMVAVAGLAVLAFAQDALAGEIVEANGPVQVNGKPVTVPAAFNKGDVIETGAGTAVFRSAAGDRITLESRTKAKSHGVEGGIEYLYLHVGAATGDISDKTTFGVPVGWATAPKDARTTIRAEAPADRPTIEGRFRTVKGSAWIRNGNTSTSLNEEHTVTLWTDAAKRGSMCFRTGQQNAGRVRVEREVSGGTIRMEIPRATSGCVEDMAGNKTKISNEITSNKQEKIAVSTHFGTPSAANIGPGTHAIIDNQTGGIEVVEDVTDESIGEEIPSFDPVEDASGASISRQTNR